MLVIQSNKVKYKDHSHKLAYRELNIRKLIKCQAHYHLILISLNYPFPIASEFNTYFAYFDL